MLILSLTHLIRNIQPLSDARPGWAAPWRGAKYGVNDVRPGLTGWAQIHGRDELEITEKAKLDGWYVEHMSFWLDVKCFFGTIRAVADHDGVVEGGTGTLHEEGK